MPSEQTAEVPAATRRRIVRDSMAVAIATGAYGVSFGAIGVASGFTVLQTCATSLLIFTGASQYAMAGVIGAGGAPFSAAATGLLLASRNLLYGLRLAPLLRLSGVRRAAAAHVVIDESTAMSITRETTGEARVGFWTTGIWIFVLWNLATLIGAVAGDHLGNPRDYGLDSAVGGAFLALLWPRLADRRNQVCALLAGALALTLVPALPAGMPVLAAVGVALGLGFVPHAEPQVPPDPPRGGDPR